MPSKYLLFRMVGYVVLCDVCDGVGKGGGTDLSRLFAKPSPPNARATLSRIV